MPEVTQTSSLDYATLLYTEVNQLTDYYVAYVLLMQEIQIKTAGDAKKASTEDNQRVINILTTLKSLAYRCLMRYKTIINVKKIPEEPKITFIQSSLKTKYEIQTDEMDVFVENLHLFLGQYLMRDVLNDGQNIISGAFANGRQ